MNHPNKRSYDSLIFPLPAPSPWQFFVLKDPLSRFFYGSNGSLIALTVNILLCAIQPLSILFFHSRLTSALLWAIILALPSVCFTLYFVTL